MWKLKPILLVEDDLVDVMTFKRALEDLQIKNEVVHTTNGEQALEYLRDPNSNQPGFIFLDLNMPKMNGIEFLKTIKGDSHFKRIPVVVLTTSDNEKDILGSFELSVAGYMIKPADYTKFVGTIRTINLYWHLSRSPDGEQDYERYGAQSTVG